MDLNPEASAINNSKGKARYTFGKNPRFSYNGKKPINDTVGYDLPDVKSMRSTSFGFGRKSDFSANKTSKG